MPSLWGYLFVVETGSGLPREADKPQCLQALQAIAPGRPYLTTTILPVCSLNDVDEGGETAFPVSSSLYQSDIMDPVHPTSAVCLPR